MNKQYKDLVNRETCLLKKIEQLDLNDEFDQAVHKIYSDILNNIRKRKTGHVEKIGKF